MQKIFLHDKELEGYHFHVVPFCFLNVMNLVLVCATDHTLC